MVNKENTVLVMIYILLVTALGINAILIYSLTHVSKNELTSNQKAELYFKCLDYKIQNGIEDLSGCENI